jgi:hypothetical protein
VFTALSFAFIVTVFFIRPDLNDDQRTILNYIFAFCAGMAIYFMSGTAMAHYQWGGPKAKFTFKALAGAAMFTFVYLHPLFPPRLDHGPPKPVANQPESQKQSPGQAPAGPSGSTKATNATPAFKPSGLKWLAWNSARGSIPRYAIVADLAKGVYVCRVQDAQFGSVIGRTQSKQCSYRIPDGERSQETYEVPTGTGAWANRGWANALQAGHATTGATTYACRVRLENDEWHGWLPGTAFDANATPENAEHCHISINGKAQKYRTFELYYPAPVPVP